MFEKIEYKIVLIRLEYGIRNVVKIITIKNLSNTVKFQNKTYIIKLEFPTYVLKLKRFYLVDFESGNQISLNEAKSLMKPEELDLVVGNKIIKELASGVIENFKEKLLWFIVGAVCGAMLAWIICQNIMQSKIDDILKETKIIALPTLNIIKMIKLWM